jgi:hypothetical protein
MSELMGTSSGPRSYNDYLLATGMEDGQQALEGFGEELDAYRSEVATQLGITPDELHWLGSDAIKAALSEMHATAA